MYNDLSIKCKMQKCSRNNALVLPSIPAPLLPAKPVNKFPPLNLRLTTK